MRYISIDLSSDNYLQQPQIFGGYAGEHNETILQVTLPPRMVGGEYSGYRFDFQTSEDNKISSPLIPVSELKNGVLSFKLTEQLTIVGKLLFNVVGTLTNEDIVSLTSKTNTIALYIGDSPEGNIQFVDPNGYKDELLTMIDERIREINPAKVDQTYNPESENAQSGKSVAEAISSNIQLFQLGKQYKAGDVVIGEKYVGEVSIHGFFKCKENHIATFNSFAEDVIDYYWEQISLINGYSAYEAQYNLLGKSLESFVDASYVKRQIDENLGDIETALDNIIAIQNSLIGGDSV